MKKTILFLFSLLASASLFGQATELYFSMYIEGSGSNKAIAIYNGTGADVDLGDYSVLEFSNGASTPNNTLSWASGQILPSGEVYVIANASADQAILNVADTTHSVTFFNGDDAVYLVKGADTLDKIGQAGERPSSGGWDVAGVTAATKNHTLTRKTTVCGPNNDWTASAGTDAASSEWVVSAIDSHFSDLDTYSGCTSNPTISITAPSDNQLFSPETTETDVSFTVTNFNVDAPSNGDGYVVYTVNAGSPQNHYTTDPIHLTGLTAGTSYTVVLELVDNNGASLSPAVSDTVHFQVADYIQVPNLAALRAGTIGQYYEVTGEVIITAGEDYGSYFKAFVQDATAGIMIYDPGHVINMNNYQIYDGVTNAKGRLTSYRDVMELVPTVDPGGPSSNGNMITPETVTVAQLNANLDDYESELIKVVNATIDPGSDTQFQLNTNYDVVQGNDTITLRVIFSSLAGNNIPSGAQNITAIAGQYYSTSQIYPRDETDFENYQSIGKNAIPQLQVYPNPVPGDYVYVRSAINDDMQIKIYDLAGKPVMAAVLSNGGKLSLKSLRQGIYLMDITQGAYHSVVKLVKK